MCKESLCQQKWNGWSALNIEKELKSRIWHCLYTAVQREKIHHLGFMKILVTRKVISSGGNTSSVLTMAWLKELYPFRDSVFIKYLF